MKNIKLINMYTNFIMTITKKADCSIMIFDEKLIVNNNLLFKQWKLFQNKLMSFKNNRQSVRSQTRGFRRIFEKNYLNK